MLFRSRLNAVVIGGSDQYVSFKWGYDFYSNYQSQVVKIPTQGVSYFGTSEYNTSGVEYSDGVALQTLKVYPNGSGKVVQTGYEADIDSFPLSIQKLEIHAKNGKLV